MRVLKYDNIIIEKNPKKALYGNSAKASNEKL
jgi:hypothetical protein